MSDAGTEDWILREVMMGRAEPAEPVINPGSCVHIYRFDRLVPLARSIVPTAGWLRLRKSSPLGASIDLGNLPRLLGVTAARAASVFNDMLQEHRTIVALQSATSNEAFAGENRGKSSWFKLYLRTSVEELRAFTAALRLSVEEEGADA